MRIRIYQIEMSLDEQNVAFRPYTEMQEKYSGDIPAKLYRMIYEGVVPTKEFSVVFYIFNMALADYPKSIPNEMMRCLYVKETLEDIDSNPENIFRKWIACMDGNGVPIYWEDLL